MKHAALSLGLIMAASAGLGQEYDDAQFPSGPSDMAETTRPTVACTSRADFEAILTAHQSGDDATNAFMLRAGICYRIDQGFPFQVLDTHNGFVAGDFEYATGEIDPLYVPADRVHFW